MNKKIYIVLFIVIFGFLSFLLYLNNKQREASLKGEEINNTYYEIKDIISEERMKEIEDAKKDLIYENFPFSALGWTRKQIIEEYGEPSRINEQYVVGEHIHYENIVFSLENEERTCNAIVIHEEHKEDVLGIFMGTKEIEKILGDADKESMSAIGTFSKTYFFDNEKVRVIFITYEEDGPVMQIYVIWDFLSE